MMYSHQHALKQHHPTSSLRLAAWHYYRLFAILILLVAIQLFLCNSSPSTHRRTEPDADIWTTVPTENVKGLFRLRNTTHLPGRRVIVEDETIGNFETTSPPNVSDLVKEPYSLPLNIMKSYIQEHSNQQLLKELDDCPSHDCPALMNRKFMVAYYSCPKQGGNRLHHFLNGLFWGIVTNRTVLWHYYDKDTCLDIGAAHNPMLCDMVGTQESCSRHLQRADWIPSATEWSRILNLSMPELAPWWSTHMPPPKNKSGKRVDKRSKFLKERHPWKEGDEKYTGIDVNSHRVLHIGQMHSWEARALRTKEKRTYFLRTPEARERAEKLLAGDLPFLYGMLFHHSFEYSPPIRPVPTKVVDSTNITTIGLHSRHGLVSDDGSNIAGEKKCLTQLLSDKQGPCAVYIMADRDTTVKLLKDHVEKHLKCQVIADDANTTYSTNAFNGKFAEMGSNPSGFWKELALVSSARDGFIGIERSSSKLLQEQMHYHAVVEGKSPPATCYLPDRERPTKKKKKKKKKSKKDKASSKEKKRTKKREETKSTKRNKSEVATNQTTLEASSPAIAGNATNETKTLTNPKVDNQSSQQFSEPTKEKAPTTTNINTLPVHSPRIQQISLLGERNSGTRWTYDHLSNCFNHTLRVELFLTRYKHWFQDPKLKIHPLKRETLVISQFRNPYDWLEAMRDRPHHAPEHLDVSWQEFVSTPWNMDRIGSDLNITSNETQCQHGFKFNQINSCAKAPLPREAWPNIRMSRHQPFYELKQDGSGEPFESIIEMRASKIRNFLETKDYPRVADTWPVHYEYLLGKGTKEMLDRIAQVTGVDYKCEPYPIQERRKRELPQEYMDYVSEHVDWETEGLIGYHREGAEIVNETAASDTNALFLSQRDITWNAKRYFYYTHN